MTRSASTGPCGVASRNLAPRFARGESFDPRAEHDWSVDGRGVVSDPARDPVACHERVAIGRVVLEVRKRGGPVRRDEAEAVPAIEPATADPVAPLEQTCSRPVRRSKALNDSPACPAPTMTVSI